MLVAQRMNFSEYIVELINIYGSSFMHIVIITMYTLTFKRSALNNRRYLCCPPIVIQLFRQLPPTATVSIKHLDNSFLHHRFFRVNVSKFHAAVDIIAQDADE